MTNENNSDPPSNASDSQPSNQPPVSPVAPEETKVGKESQRRANQNQDATRELAREFRWVEFAQIGSNVGLLIVGVIALCIYTGQLNQMRSSNKTARDAAQAASNSAREAKNANDLARDALIRVQRAFVIINPNGVHVEASKNMGQEQAHFFFPMGNTGTTPTRNLTAHINWAFDPNPLPKNFAYHDAGDRTQNNLTPVIGPRDSYPLEAIISRQQFETWQRHEMHLYFYGWVEYNDIFDKTPRHTTRFSYEAISLDRIRLAGGQESTALQLITIGTFFNCYDEECKPRN